MILLTQETFKLYRNIKKFDDGSMPLCVTLPFLDECGQPDNESIIVIADDRQITVYGDQAGEFMWREYYWVNRPHYSAKRKEEATRILRAIEICIEAPGDKLNIYDLIWDLGFRP